VSQNNAISYLVLIDDRESLQEEWERAGGIFIHHTDTKSTLEKLQRRGILLDANLANGDRL